MKRLHGACRIVRPVTNSFDFLVAASANAEKLQMSLLVGYLIKQIRIKITLGSGNKPWVISGWIVRAYFVASSGRARLKFLASSFPLTSNVLMAYCNTA